MIRHHAALRKFSSFIIIVLLCLAFLPRLAPHACADGEKIVVVLDAGHGGMDGGSAVGIRLEKEYNLLLAQYVAEILRANGNFEVVMTRTDDTYLKFLPRALCILDANADVLISLHCNSTDISSANGTLAIVSKIDRFNASALAGSILDSISASVDLARGNVETRADTGDELGVYYWNSDRQWDMPGASALGVTSDYFSINTWASKFGTPSIIIEHGYLSNEHDRTLLDSDDNLRAIAAAEAQAIIDFYTGHTHQWSADKTVDYPSSCTLTGTRSYRCSICGMKSGTESLAPVPDAHYWRQSASRAATCTEDGFIEYICQISDNLNSKGYTCEVHTYTETLTATGHQYQVIEDTQAAHGQDGRFLRKCSLCGDVIDEIRPGDPHTYEVTADVAPTCTTDGGVTYTCTVCGDSYTETAPALGHDFAEAERKDVFGDEDGYIKYVCRTCGEEKVEVLSACEHLYENRIEVAPTCETDGKITETCAKCGYVREEILPAAGHDMAVTLDVAPSCEKDGYYRAVCRVCGYEVTETRPAIGHSYEVTEETDTHVTKVCVRCQAERTEEVTRRSLRSLFQHPLLAAVVIVILVQLAAIPIILLRHRRHQKKHHEAWLHETGDYEEDYDEDYHNVKK
ncbi:MAG: N-acetylmuramoyl-L-alanine amidase [Eubacteriales bacterium]